MTNEKLSDICTTPSPLEELTFDELAEHCKAYNVELGDDFREELRFVSETGRPTYLGYLFSDQNERSLTLSRFGGFDNGIGIDAREFGRCSLAKSVMLLSETLLDENVIRTKGMDRGTNAQVEVSSLLSAIFFAIAGNDWLLEKSTVIEMYCDRLDIRVFGDAASFLTDEDGALAAYSFGPFPELTEVLVKIGFLSEKGIDLGIIVKNYGADVFVISPFAATLSLPLAINTLYSGKYCQPTINKPNSLANALGVNEMCVSDMMTIMGEAYYDKFKENYLDPAVKLGLIEAVGAGDSRSQRYRRTVIEEL